MHISLDVVSLMEGRERESEGYIIRGEGGFSDRPLRQGERVVCEEVPA